MKYLRHMSRFSRYAGSRPPTRLDARRPTRHSALVTTPSSRGDLGDEIRRRRKERNMTQADLAKLAAVATTLVGNLEKGRRVSDTTLRAVARALDLPAELTAPFLTENQDGAGTSPSGLSEEERSMIRLLRRRGWSAGDIAEALDELRRSSADLPGVREGQEHTGTDR